jgi:integrase/recombinase XerD
MVFSDAMAGFLLDRDGNSTTDLSPHTLALYRKLLTQVSAFLGDPDVKSITEKDLTRFMDWLEREYVPRSPGKKRLSGYARDNYYKAIRSFFHWGSKELGLLRVDIHIPRPIVTPEDVDPYDEAELKKILAACDFTREARPANRKAFKMHRPTAIRDRAIILLLLDTGVRLGEMIRLKIEDVDLESSEIRVRPFRNGKKSKPRFIPFEKGCKKALWRYIKDERHEAEPEDPFFPVEEGAIQSMFQRLTERTGINRVHAHRFRHTFAIQYLRNGGNIFTLQRNLGHTSLDMCRKYLAIAQCDVKEGHRRASPVDNWRL